MHMSQLVDQELHNHQNTFSLNSLKRGGMSNACFIYQRNKSTFPLKGFLKKVLIREENLLTTGITGYVLIYLYFLIAVLSCTPDAWVHWRDVLINILIRNPLAWTCKKCKPGWYVQCACLPNRRKKVQCAILHKFPSGIHNYNLSAHVDLEMSMWPREYYFFTFLWNVSSISLQLWPDNAKGHRQPADDGWLILIF